MNQNPLIIQMLPRGQFTPLEAVTVQGLTNAAVNIILIIACILFIFSLLSSGLRLMLSGGNREKLDHAKRQLVNAFLGITIVFSTWAIMNFVSSFFGIDLLTFEIPTV